MKEIIKILKQEKISTMSSLSFNPELTLKKGNHSKTKPNREDKDDIKKAIMVSIGVTIQAKQNPEVLITGYMELGLFQKYQDVDSSDLMDPDPKKYLAKRAKHKKMIEKANAESKKLLTEIRGWEKTMRKKFK